MQVAICTSPLSSGHKNRGTGTYTTHLTEALKAYPSKHRFSFFEHQADIPGNCDVIHYPFFDPFFLTLFIHKQIPTVVTVHDLIPLVFPKRFPRGIKGEVKWQMQKRNLTKAARIITDSRHSSGDIRRITGIPEDRIDVIPLAPSCEMKPVSDPDILSAVMEKYDLPHEFVLYVGDVNWNKNIEGLLSAWHLVMSRSMLPHDTRLVLVGSAFTDPDLAEARAIDSEIRKRKIDDSVIRTGYVPSGDLRVMYMLAGANVFPSLYEGFGFPVLEAMASGGITVTSDAASLKEIAGPSVIVDPKSPGDIARGIAHACRLHTATREKQIEAGLDWVKHFSWKDVARNTIASYERAASD